MAAKASEVRIYQPVFHQGHLKGLEKVMSLTSQKREVLSVSYDSNSSQYVMTTGKDQQMIVYQIDSHYQQAKVLGSHQITSINEMTLSSLCVVEKFASQKPIAYAAIADGNTFEVYAGGISDH